MFIQTPDTALGNIQLAADLTATKVSDKSLEMLHCLLLE
jgi:hypothetical protein